jgi:pimeloyl-ACP methyl ester carboxylesterase
MKLVIALGTAVALYVALCAWLYVTQRSMLYYPVPEGSSSAGHSIRFPVDGAVLRIWNLERGSTRALIYFGGNAEDVGASVAEFAQAFSQRSLFFVNYRGYGGSTGAPAEKTLVADAVALFDHISKTHTDIVVVGRSLGSGVAVQLAAARTVSKLILVTPFDSIARVGQALMPWLPVSLLARDRYDSISRAPSLTCPVLVLIAAEDAVIRRVHSDTLVAAFAPSLARTIVVNGAGHNDIQLWPNYYDTMVAFAAS